VARKRRKNNGAVGSTLIWIDNQRRVDVSREPVSSALDLKINAGETIHVWALPGAENQLQLFPPNSELAQLRDLLLLEKGLGGKTVSWDAGEDADVRTYRQLEGFFRVACRLRKSGNTLRLTLPSDAIDLGYFKSGEPLIVFCAGELVELWPRDRWREVSSVQDLRELTRRASRALPE